jgi:hypothetical protein
MHGLFSGCGQQQYKVSLKILKILSKGLLLVLHNQVEAMLIRGNLHTNHKFDLNISVGSSNELSIIYNWNLTK